jgi:Tfp pilus assembly protein PilE
MQNKNYKTGYVILELLFYFLLFSILSIVVINSMLTMLKSFKETTIQAELVQSGTIMERISREVRGAYAISSINATDLVLNTKDSAGVNKTVRFLLSGTNLQLLENSVLTGNLNIPTISVTSLTFSSITTAQGTAVKISLTVKSTSDSLNRTETLYDTVVLRGDYQ